jgi:hypothetical protein
MFISDVLSCVLLYNLPFIWCPVASVMCPAIQLAVCGVLLLVLCLLCNLLFMSGVLLLVLCPAIQPAVYEWYPVLMSGVLCPNAI